MASYNVPARRRDVLDISTIKFAATSRWLELISRIGGVSQEILDGNHHPCPKCGGNDRFRMIDAKDGAVMCNKCFSKSNGDGIAAIMWLTQMTFYETIKRLADELNMEVQKSDVDVVQEMAWRKGISTTSLVAYGASVAKRGEGTVCRIPMHSPDMTVVGHFDMAPWSEEMAKGKMTHGSTHGLFVSEPPFPGCTIAVVEGVKDAAALHNMGIQAVGLPTNRMDATFARIFRGCDVVVIPDRDKAGIEGAEETCSRLYGVASSVKVAELPIGYKETGGGDVRDVLRMRDGNQKLLDSIKNARRWSPTSAKATIKFTKLADAVLSLIAEEDPTANLLKLGLPDLDNALSGGVARGEMVIIAGRPSHGKTTIGLQCLDHLTREVPVLILSEEMSVRALAERSFLGMSDVQLKSLNYFREQAHKDVTNHFNERMSFYVVESCSTVERACAAIDMAVEEKHVEAVAVDYVQLLRGNGNSRYEQVSDVSTKLKQSAVKNNVLLLALCQLNRAPDSRPTTCPRMSDLRDSGQLEQDADVIVFVEWLYRTSPEAHDKSEYRMYVAKNRNRGIQTSIIDCVFMPERQRIFVKESRSGEWNPSNNLPQVTDDF